MKFLVTGAAGFIGFHVTKNLLESGNHVIALDNINDYYDVELKFSRLKLLGLNREAFEWNKPVSSTLYPEFTFVRANVEDREFMELFFRENEIDVVVHLAAQAGVRYSIENPYAYIQSNINGFMNILEGCRHNKIKHLVYASSSSVYGMNAKVPFSEKDGVDHPVSLYAATKKSNELMAHTYSHLYGIPTSGLRFFTVYGPWGRPDMSPFLFADAILNDRPIKVFNNGDMLRDFTYIDDITEGVIQVLKTIPKGNKKWDPMHPDPSSSTAPYKIYNLGNSSPVKLMDFIENIEKATGRRAEKIFMPMQSGDVYQTFADTTILENEFGFKPKTTIEEGVNKTVKWFMDYYKLNK